MLESRIRLLCIDDDADFAEVLTRQLNPRGIAVIHAFDAIQGYHMALSERPDVIITDYCMPYRFGTHLLRQLREVPELTQVPVIVVTGRDIHGHRSPVSDPSQTRLLEDLGACNVLRKPLNWQALFDAIEACAPIPQADPNAGGPLFSSHALRPRSARVVP